MIYTAEYYLYLNLTKPSQRLYVSYANKDAEGNEKRPSYLIGKLNGLFPGLKIQNPAELQDAFSVMGTDGGKSTLIASLRNYREGKETVYLTELIQLMAACGEDEQAKLSNVS